MTNPRANRVAVVAAGLAFGVLSMEIVRAVDLKASIPINIAAQSLEAALLELSKQGHMQVVIATGSLPVRQSAPLSGNMSLERALDLLLKDSGLSYKVVGEHTIAIIKSADSSTPSVDPQETPSPLGKSGNDTATAGNPSEDVNGKSRTKGDRKVVHRGLIVRLAAFFGLCVSAAASDRACADTSGTADVQGLDAGAGPVLEEIIVTAEKRATDLQKTPISMAAVLGGDLMQRGQTQLDQVMANVGAVRLLEGEDGPTFYIRGIGTGVPANVGDPEANLNIDGIYQSEPEFARGGLYDVSRIEVLRGPQGTLYGRNAVAGVVNIVTNDPIFEYAAGASVGAGNYNLVQSQGFLNVPLTETLALRGAFGTESHRGYLSNGANDADAQSARVKLLWKPNDQLRLLLAADITHEGGEGEGEIQVSPPPPGFPIATYSLGNVFTSAHPWTSPDPGDAVRHTDFWSLHAQLDWDLRFATLTILPSYRHYDYQCLNCWRSESDQNNFTAERQTTAEVRLASNRGAPFTWLAGLYYLHSNTPTSGQNLGPGADSFSDASGNQVNEQGQTEFVAESYAAFGQVTIPITSTLRVTGGLRETNDRKSETGYVLGEQGGVINSCSTSTPAPWPSFQSCLFDTSKSWRSLTYTAGVELDLAAASMAYAKVSTGYKAGGFYQGAAPDSYDPEHLTSYEIGSKSRFLDNRLELDADVFYYDYRDYQVNFISFINPADAGIFGIVTANAQGATIYGADIEARYQLTAADLFDAGLYPLHARFRTLVIPGIFGGDFSHYPLPFAPNFAANLGYQHRWLLNGNSSLSARLETHIESATWVTFQQATGTHQPSHTVSNAYLIYESQNSKWSLTGYVKNLENTPVLVNAQGGPAMLEAADIAPPRTFGVQLSAKF
jgi:iron complex outermembrane receptor protein